MYLLDTNILIYHFDNSVPNTFAESLNSILKNHFNISVITRIEFLGFRKHTEESFHKASEFLEYSRIIGIEDPIIEKAIQLRRAFSVRLPDAVIAATAIVYDLTLITRNEDDFNSLGVRILNPFASEG